MMQTEFDYQGVTIVLQGGMKFDDAREFLVNTILLYAQKKDVEVKIIFFNARLDGSALGVNTIFWPPEAPR